MALTVGISVVEAVDEVTCRYVALTAILRTLEAVRCAQLWVRLFATDGRSSRSTLARVEYIIPSAPQRVRWLRPHTETQPRLSAQQRAVAGSLQVWLTPRCLRHDAAALKGTAYRRR